MPHFAFIYKISELIEGLEIIYFHLYDYLLPLSRILVTNLSVLYKLIHFFKNKMR